MSEQERAQNRIEVVSESIPPGAWNPGSLHQHFTTRLSDIANFVEAELRSLQEQVDRRLETQLRERKDTERHLEQMIEAVKDREGMQEEAGQAALEAQKEWADLEYVNIRESIKEQHSALLLHIREQIASVKTALTAQERLNEEQDARAQDRFEAAQKAIDK
ncbi:MAG: hypothetical protein M3355_12165, partial [Actinomycetota bacterium]|nr:hypothetical protein [Actinomycetota bacterium]